MIRALVAVVILPLLSVIASACDCNWPKDMRGYTIRAVERSDIVAEIRFVAVESRRWSRAKRAYEGTARYSIVKSWKGPSAGSIIRIDYTEWTSSCGWMNWRDKKVTYGFASARLADGRYQDMGACDMFPDRSVLDEIASRPNRGAEPPQ